MALEKRGGGDANFGKAAEYGAAGAAAGSALGPLGTLAGGAIGGLVGLFDGIGGGGYVDAYGNAIAPGTEAAYDPETWEQDWSNLQAREALANQAYAQGDQTSAQALGMLRQAALGDAPSQAEIQMRAGLDQALRNQFAAAASSRSGNPAATFRQANMAGLGASLQTNQQAAALRANEMAQARGQFANAAAGQQQLLQQRAQHYLALGFNMDQAEAAARQDAARLQSEIAMGQMANSTQREAAMMQAGASTINTAVQSAPAVVGAVSDRRAKENVSKGDDDVKQMLEALAAYSYDYKDEGHGKGRQFGIMAQDLEKTAMGRSLVEERDGIKMVRTDKASLAALAGLASLNKRLRAMEDGR